MPEERMERKNFVPGPIRKGLFAGKTDKPDKSRGKLDGDRRKLKTYQLVPPDYIINPQILLDSYVEIGIRFAGIAPQISSDIDPTMRTDILKIIDAGKKQEILPWYMTHEHDAIFSLSAYNLKISKRSSPEELQLRVAIHDIAAICYIKDDSAHILGLKYGEVNMPKDTCNLAVFHCDSRASAEEICSLIGQCFQLVYTDATMQFFDRQLLDGANNTVYNHFPNILRRDHDSNGQAFLSDSIVDQSPSTSRSLSRVGVRRKPSTTRSLRSESDLSTSARDLLHDYMRRLHTKLSAEELCQFAMLLKAWHTDLPFQDFCDKVLSLYGSGRKHLLAGMRPFIPEKDYMYFENFLERHGVNGGSPNYRSMDYSRYKRTVSEASGHSSSSLTMQDNEIINMDEIDQMLSEISQEIQTMETSVDSRFEL